MDCEYQCTTNRIVLFELSPFSGTRADGSPRYQYFIK
jgi:hypothetical protein